MIRTFQPIGQGTFVTEQFEHGHNVVFDCGSMTSLPWTQKLIQTNFRQGEFIDGVFLSSIDQEHAGGLETLMQWCQVQKVFVPYLEPDERGATLLKYLCEGGQPDDFLATLITNPKQALSAYRIPSYGVPVVTQVCQENEWEKNVFDKKMPMYLMPWKAVAGFRVYVDEDMDWIYQVQVYRQRVDMERLTECLTAHGVAGWIASAAILRRGWRQNPTRNELTKAYAQVGQPFCAVSLAVYSGPERQEYPTYEQFTQKGQWTRRARVRSGSLYTGSLRLREQQIRVQFQQHFQTYGSHTGCLLLPGHGTSALFHQDVLPGRHSVVVAAADNENLQCLPHGSVVRSVMDHRIPFYLVTELPGSTVRFAIKEAPHNCRQTEKGCNGNVYKKNGWEDSL